MVLRKRGNNETNIKAWLDKLFYYYGKQQHDFWLCSMRKEGDRVISTKWQKYSSLVMPLDFYEGYKLFSINNRSILPNELVLDIEKKENLEEIKRKLKDLNINHYFLYDTGSKGYHIHIFSIKEISGETKRFFIEQFGADSLKAGDKTMIALENVPHWKTGNIKRLISKDGFDV